MPNHSLLTLIISISLRLGGINDLAHLGFLLISQVDIPRSPVLLQPVRLGCAGNGNHALSSNPRQGHLADRTASLACDFLDLIHDLLVGVEIFTLELGGYPRLVGITKK